MSPRDFLAENDNQDAKNQNMPIDYLSEDPIQQESLGTALSNAPGRILSDIGSGALSVLNAIPDYYEKAKIEIPAIPSAFKNNPLSALGQEYAGMGELGMSVFNFTHDIINYLSNRLNLFPKNINKIIQMARMPESETQQMINQTFGQPSQPGEAALRGINRNLEAVTGLGSLATNLPRNILSFRHALNRIDKEKVASSIQRSHDILENSAINKFNKVGQEAIKRNVNVVPIRKDLTSDIAQYLPDTQRTRLLLSNASSGKYQGLRDLQSDLFHRGNSALKSPLQADKNVGELLHDLRHEINESISDHFKNTGHIDLAEQLNQGRSQYRLLKDTYYGKKTPNAIKNLVHPESRKMPENLMNVLSEKSIPMKKIMKTNPFAEKYAQRYQRKLEALDKLKTLKNVGLGTAGIGGTILEAPHLYQYLFGEPKKD